MTVRILHVEDFDHFRGYVRDLLRGYTQFQVIAEACDGITGVRKAAELQPDIILLDIDLPLLSGIEAAREMARVSPASRILFLSQQTWPEIILHAFRLGAWAYIMKTDTARELLPALTAVSNGTRFFNRHSKQQTGILTGTRRIVAVPEA